MSVVLFARRYAEELINFTAKHEQRISRYLLSMWRKQADMLAKAEMEYAMANQEVPLEWIFAWQTDYAEFINTEIDPVWREAIKESGDIIARAVSESVAPFNFTPTGRNIVYWIENRAGELIKNLTDTQVTAVRNILRHYLVEQPTDPQTVGRFIRSVVGLTEREARAVSRMRDALLREGISADKIDKQVERYVKTLHRERGIRIARTEMSYAWNQGEYLAVTEAQEKGILRGLLKKEWITARDELTCDICASMDGEVVDKDELFSGGFLVPPAHPRCRCCHAYIMEG